MSDYVADPPFTGGRWTLWDSELPFGAIGGGCAITQIPPSPGVRFVDIGFEVTDTTPNGDVCIAEVYLREMAVGIGCVLPEEYALVLAQLSEAYSELELLRGRVPEAFGSDDISASLARIEAALDKPPTPRKPRTSKET